MSRRFHRGWRRHHRRRMICRAAAVYGENQAPRLADHLKSCSCWMCGNRRKYSKGRERLTLVERRAAQVSDFEGR